MIEKAKEKKVFLMEACFSRFFPVWRALKEQLNNKTLGEATSIHANMANHSYVSWEKMHLLLITKQKRSYFFEKRIPYQKI